MPEIASIFGKAIDTGFNILENGVYNTWSSEREKNARKENYYYNEAAASQADIRTRRLYDDYMTPQALLRMYKEAGLSPSMMFGEGAAAPQPTQGAQGAGTSGISPQVFGSTVGSLVADNTLKIAEARKANAQADTIQGKNDRGRNEIEKLAGEVEYQYLANEAVNWDNSVRALNTNLLASYGEEELKAKIKEMQESANLLHEQAREQKVKGNIATKTEQKIIETIDANYRKILADIAYTKAAKKLAEKQAYLTNEQARTVMRTVMDNHHAVMLKDEEVYINYRIANKTIETKLKELGLQEEKMRWEISKILFDEIINTSGLLYNNRPSNIGFR